jgi:hypothetical protein
MDAPCFRPDLIRSSSFGEPAVQPVSRFSLVHFLEERMDYGY